MAGKASDLSSKSMWARSTTLSRHTPRSKYGPMLPDERDVAESSTFLLFLDISRPDSRALDFPSFYREGNAQMTALLPSRLPHGA